MSTLTAFRSSARVPFLVEGLGVSSVNGRTPGIRLSYGAGFGVR